MVGTDVRAPTPAARSRSPEREDLTMITTRPTSRTASRVSGLMLAGLLAGGIGLGALACAAGPRDTAGRVDGTSALVAVVGSANDVVAYVRDEDTGIGERVTTATSTPVGGRR